jgi:multidrug efflux system membrane fusion protein
MRVFSLLAAIAVSAFLYLLIFERPWLFGTSEGPGPTAEQSEATADLANLVKVVVKKSQAQAIDSAVVLRGQTNAARQVHVKAETSAIVVSSPLRKGATVEEGQALCVLDEGTRGAQLDQAKAAFAEAQARVPEAQARLTQALALLEEAKINQNAAAKLSKDGFASTTRVANSDAAVAAAEAGVQSARAGLQATQSGIQAAQASVASASKEIERLTIRAPFAGLLESDSAELGTLLQPGALCATVIQLDPIKLVAFVPETEVNRVEVGALAGAKLAAGGDQVQGQVTFLSRSADETTRTFRVEIDVPNADGRIRDGQTAEILIASMGAQAHLIPQSALTLDDHGSLGLRTVDEGGTVAFFPVEIMRDTAKGVWVTGLPDQADIIVLGQEYVTAGVQVAPTYEEQGQ